MDEKLERRLAKATDIIKRAYNDINSEYTLKHSELRFLYIFMRKNYKNLQQNYSNNQDFKELNKYLIEIMNGTMTAVPGGKRDKINTTVNKSYSSIMKSIKDIPVLNNENPEKEDIEISLERLENLANLGEIEDINLWKKTVQALLKQGVNVYESNAIKKYFDEYTELICEDYKLTPKSFDFIKECINEITKSPKFSLFERREITNIIQLIHKGKFSKEESKQIIKILEENLENNGVDLSQDINLIKAELDSIMKQDIISDRDDMDNFIKNLEILKLINLKNFENENIANLEKKYVEFVFKQAYMKGSVVYKDQSRYGQSIDRMIEEIAGIDLMERGIPLERGICCFIKEELSPSHSTLRNLFNEKCYYYSKACNR